MNKLWIPIFLTVLNFFLCPILGLQVTDNWHGAGVFIEYAIFAALGAYFARNFHDLSNRVENDVDLDIALKALKDIVQQEGKVCSHFEFCKHESCTSSYSAWFIANEALEEIGRK